MSKIHLHPECSLLVKQQSKENEYGMVGEVVKNSLRWILVSCFLFLVFLRIIFVYSL